MARKSTTWLLFEFVEDYINGDMERIFFDLNINRYLLKYYPSMERNSPKMADCFLYYLSEQGMNLSEGLSDAQHKKLIREQWRQFCDTINSGLL